MPWRNRFHKDSSDFQSISSLLRKDLCDSNLQAFLGGSSYTDSPSDSAPDPLLSSFIVNYPMADPLEDARLELPEKTSMVDKISVEKVVESLFSLVRLLDLFREETDGGSVPAGIGTSGKRMRELLCRWVTLTGSGDGIPKFG
ncbi:hypothetical protein B296_00001875 [Ensete ventricosum]|uniref:Di19 C-terminal domain-containing protein n=1 Tax=Ensete ventricosum TaxID=4639 RepID=A0A427A5M6_ENSVE|nr:hypothetical protein B296_00001875 [Ensete ventricosum]